jgi:hypothetical protein
LGPIVSYNENEVIAKKYELIGVERKYKRLRKLNFHHNLQLDPISKSVPLHQAVKACSNTHFRLLGPVVSYNENELIAKKYELIGEERKDKRLRKTSLSS